MWFKKCEGFSNRFFFFFFSTQDTCSSLKECIRSLRKRLFCYQQKSFVSFEGTRWVISRKIDLLVWENAFYRERCQIPVHLRKAHPFYLITPGYVVLCYPNFLETVDRIYWISPWSNTIVSLKKYVLSLNMHPCRFPRAAELKKWFSQYDELL